MSTLDFELKKFQQSHPGMSFVQSWRALKQNKPELFTGYSRPASPTGTASSGIRIPPRLVAKRLRAKAELIRAAEGVSFAQAWAALRQREPELFGVVTARRGSGSEVVVCQGGFATPLW